MINKLKKITLYTALAMMFLNVMPEMSFAANNAVSPKETLNAIESGLFGYEYNNDSETKRIERIEKHLYGETRTGDINQRIEAVKNDTGFTVMPKLAEKKENQEQSAKNGNSEGVKQAAAGAKADKQSAASKERELKESAEVEYPIVDQMEEEIFKTTYKNESIYSRLDRLEDKVFQKKTNADLSERVDKLASVVIPKQKNTRVSETYSPEDLNEYYSASGYAPVDNQSVPFQVGVLEEDIFKTQYPGDTMAKRLTRLEQKLFNRTFTTDSDVTRIQRLTVAYDAKQSSYKYENNRKAQNMATMTQIGGILLMILAMLL